MLLCELFISFFSHSGITALPTMPNAPQSMGGSTADVQAASAGRIALASFLANRAAAAAAVVATAAARGGMYSNTSFSFLQIILQE